MFAISLPPEPVRLLTGRSRNLAAAICEGGPKRVRPSDRRSLAGASLAAEPAGEQLKKSRLKSRLQPELAAPQLFRAGYETLHPRFRLKLSSASVWRRI
jgi:hypothetical protein